MTIAIFSPTATSNYRMRAIGGFLTVLLVLTTGCGSSNQRLQQLQNENDRLLSEFRAQRDQVTQLNERLAAMQNRLAESEKLLARQSPLPSSRLSRLNNDVGSLPPGDSLSTDRISGSTNRSIESPPASASSPNSGNSPTDSELYWRPMRREAP